MKKIAYVIAGASLFVLASSLVRQTATGPRRQSMPRENGGQVIDMALWKEMRGWRQSGLRRGQLTADRDLFSE